VVIAMLALVAAMHPLHTTMTEVTVDEARHTVRAVVRVFVDDFSNAARRSGSPDVYLARGLSLTDGAARSVALRSCGTRRTGDVMFICAEGAFSGSARAIRISDTLLCNVFDDQINVVQITTGADRRSSLFTCRGR